MRIIMQEETDAVNLEGAAAKVHRPSALTRSLACKLSQNIKTKAQAKTRNLEKVNLKSSTTNKLKTRTKTKQNDTKNEKTESRT